MNTNTSYWLDLSDYDLETAKAMLSTGRYLYVGFMCHQAIEKILKAYLSSLSKEIVPKIHNLSRLIEVAELDRVMTDSQMDIVST